jgi:hypothetical protein
VRVGRFLRTDCSRSEGKEASQAHRGNQNRLLTRAAQ